MPRNVAATPTVEQMAFSRAEVRTSLGRERGVSRVRGCDGAPAHGPPGWMSCAASSIHPRPDAGLAHIRRSPPAGTLDPVPLPWRTCVDALLAGDLADEQHRAVRQIGHAAPRRRSHASAGVVGRGGARASPPDELRVIETHPGGRQYDCLSVYRRDADASLVVHLNVSDHLTDAPWFDRRDDDDVRFNWFEVLAAKDRRTYVIVELERVCGLPSPTTTPTTTQRSIGSRLMARFASSASLSLRRWEIRNAVYDSSSDGSSIRSWVNELPGVMMDPLPGDLLGEPAYRIWYVLDEEHRPFTAIDVDRGVAWRHDGNSQTFELMQLCATKGRRLDEVAYVVLPAVE
jgi:hypothetical protein